MDETIRKILVLLLSICVFVIPGLRSRPEAKNRKERKDVILAEQQPFITDRPEGNMMLSMLVALLTSALLLLGLSSAAEGPEPLEVKAGDRATLLCPVSSQCEDQHVLWDVNNELLVLFDEGQHQREPPDRYRGRLSLDHRTGSLNISDLRPEDSGLYTGQITCPVMHKVHYNVTVVEAAPVINLDPVPDSAARHHWTAGVCAFIFLFVLV